MRLTKQACCPAPSVGPDAGGSMTGNESFVTVNDDTATLPNSRQLTAGTGISVTDGGAGDPITVANTAPENTSVANVGTGAGQSYRDMTGAQINLKTIKAGTGGITVTNNADDVTISGTAPITRIPQSIWVPAPVFRPLTNGAYAPSFVWVEGVNTAFQTLKYPRVDGGESYIAVSTVKLPPGYDATAGAVVRGLWYSTGADIINPVQWQVSAYSVAAGAAVDNGAWGGTPAHALANGADAWGVVFQATAALIAAKDVFYVRIIRGYPFNTDINLDTAYFVGAMLTFSVDPTVF